MVIGLLFLILPLVVVIFFTYHAYVTAVQFEKPRWWAAVVFGSGLGVLILVPVILGLAAGIIFGLLGGGVETVESDGVGITVLLWLIGVVSSIATMMFLISRLTAVDLSIDEEISVPPPPTFN